MTSKPWLLVVCTLAVACSSGTPDPVGYQCIGSGTLTAKIDGEAFASTCLTATNQGGLIILEGVDDAAGKNSNENNIHFVATIKDAGTFPFTGDGDPDLSWSFKSRAGAVKPAGGGELGSIVVTKLTATQIEGTFTATTVSNEATKKTVALTEGKFSGTFGTE